MQHRYFPLYIFPKKVGVGKNKSEKQHSFGSISFLRPRAVEVGLDEGSIE